MNGISGTVHIVFRTALARCVGNASASDLLSARVDRLLGTSSSASSQRAIHFVRWSPQITRHALQMGELWSDGSIPVWCTECNTVVERREQRSQLG